MEYGVEIYYPCILYGKPLVVYQRESWNGLNYQNTIKLKKVDLSGLFGRIRIVD